MSLQWTNEKRKLRDLIPRPDNPRQISEADAERLERSLAEFGQVQTIAIESDNTLVDGHQRAIVWAAAQKFGDDYEVDVRVASRSLNADERQALIAALHGGASGSWDWDMLNAEFDFTILNDWGFDQDLLHRWNTDSYNLREMMNAQEGAPDVLELWGGMPEFEQEENTGSIHAIKVNFPTEQDLHDFGVLIGQPNITMKTRTIFFPAAVREDTKAHEWADESDG